MSTPDTARAAQTLVIGAVEAAIGDGFIPDEHSDAQATGPYVTFLEAVGQRCGVRIVFEFSTLKRGVESTRKGIYDGWLMLAKTPERETYLLYPDQPLFTDDVVMISAKRRNLSFTSLYHLPDRTVIGYPNGAQIDKFSEHARRLNFYNVGNSVDLVMSLANMLFMDRVDYILFMSRSIVTANIGKTGMEDWVTVHETPVAQRDFYVALSQLEHGPKYHACYNAFLAASASDHTQTIKPGL